MIRPVAGRSRDSGNEVVDAQGEAGADGRTHVHQGPLEAGKVQQRPAGNKERAKLSDKGTRKHWRGRVNFSRVIFRRGRCPEDLHSKHKNDPRISTTAHD